MGYCIDMEECTMKIKKDKMKEALKLLIGKGFRWCCEIYEEDLEFGDVEELNETLECIRYGVIEKDDYYLIDEFYGEKLGDDFEIFNTIAQYCEDGGYIEFLGEDGERFRFVIKNGQCKEVYPKISWE